MRFTDCRSAQWENSNIMKKIMIFATLLTICCALRAAAVQIEVPSEIRLVEKYRGGVLLSAQMSHGPTPIIIMSGTHEDMGRQYGYLLAEQIAESAKSLLLDAVVPYGLDEQALRTMAAAVWANMLPFVPGEYQEEIKGVIAGAAEKGVTLDALDLAIPIVLTNISDMSDKKALLTGMSSALNLVRFAFTCSAFAAWGPRTVDGKLLSSRVLDWEPGTGIDRFKILAIYKPVDAQGNSLASYAVAGWAGFIGAVDGMNEYGVTLSEIGSGNRREKIAGMPWTLMFRQVLEHSQSLDDAVKIVQDSENTIGYIFLIGDGDAENFGAPAWSPGAAAIEENAEITAVIYADDPIDRDAVWIDNQGQPVLVDGKPVPYGTPLKHAVLRADVAMSPEIRKTQVADNGPGEEGSDGNPLAGGSYRRRHKSQFDALVALETGASYNNPYSGAPVFPAASGKRLLDPQTALELAASAAMPESCVITIVYAATDRAMYVSWENLENGKWTASFERPFMKVDLMDLIARNAH